jgi:hypothetical protein
LAREAARNHVNNSAPQLAIKGSHVVPDWKRREKAVVLSGAQYSAAIGVDFNGADGAESTHDTAEDSPARSGEQREFS